MYYNYRHFLSSAARSWGVGRLAVQLTKIPSVTRASAVVGPIAANCKESHVTGFIYVFMDIEQ